MEIDLTASILKVPIELANGSALSGAPHEFEDLIRNSPMWWWQKREM